MVSDERDHFRAIKLVRTGYPIKPTIPYPTWGSVVARDRWDPGFDLPAFVRIGKPRIKTRDVNSGVLGPRYESFKIDEPGKLPEDVHPAVPPDVLQRRLALAAKLDEQFAARGSRQGGHRAARNLRPHQPVRPQPAARRVQSRQGAGEAPRCLRPQRVRPGVPARPAAGRGGRELRRGDQRRHARTTRAGTRTSAASRRTRSWPARPTAATRRC